MSDTDLAWLRVLSTTDLHAELRDFDYARNRPDLTKGLSRAGSLIGTLRAGAEASVLLDNGDFLFGRPYAVLPDGGVPAVLGAMSLLDYDAVNLGNHEFDRGFGAFLEMIDGPALPVVSASFVGPEGDSVFPEGQIVLRRMTTPSGAVETLRIGVTGLLPEGCLGGVDHLSPHGVTMRDPLDALGRAAEGLRRRGADIVILLCHGGLSDEPSEDLPQRLAQSGLVDAMVLGHTHDVFPDPSWDHLDGVDSHAGTIHGVPTVMPGHWGSHVGCIDLGLAWDGSRFRPAAARGTVHAISPRDRSRPPNAPEIMLASRSVHAASLAANLEPVARVERPLYSFFAQLGYCPATMMCASAIASAVRAALPPEAQGLPVIGLAAPMLCGGYGGPGDYLDIRPGDLLRRDLIRLAPHSDLAVGLAATGRDLRLWLERSMSAFHQVVPGEHAPELIDPAFPPSDFDVPHGLEYTVDLTRPAMWSYRGLATGAGPGRVRDLRIDGVPLDDDAPVVIATTTHRSGGGGRFPVPDRGPAVDTGIAIGPAIVHRLQQGFQDVRPEAFAFARVPYARAVFSTGPAGMAYLSHLGVRGIRPLGKGQDGFLKLLMDLDPG